MHTNATRGGRADAIEVLAAGAMRLQCCPFSGLLDDCFGETWTSRWKYGDMNAFEKPKAEDAGGQGFGG